MTSDQVLQTVWIHAVQISVVVFLAVIATSLLRARTRLCWAIWLVVLLKCVTPPVLNHELSLFSSTAGVRTAVVKWWSTDGEPVTVAAEVVSMAGPPLSSTEIEFQSATGDLFLESSSVVVQNPAEDGTAIDESPIRNSFSYWLIAVLGALSVCSFSLMFLRYVRCQRQLQRSECHDFDERLRRLLAEVCEELSLAKWPRIVVTKTRFGPAVIGIFRPVIVMPHVLVQQLDDDTLKPVIAHELIHIRRGDLFVGWLQAVAHCLWWFHPCVWLANRAISRVTEQCCDQQVLAETTCGARHYAQSLLAVIECRSRLVPVPIFPGMKPVEITQQRLEKIMTLKHGGSRRSNMLTMVLILAMSALVLPSGIQGQTVSSKAAKEKTKTAQSAAIVPDTKVVVGGTDSESASETKQWQTLQLPDGPITGDLVVAVVDGTEITAEQVAGNLIRHVEGLPKLIDHQKRKAIQTHLRRGIDRFIEQEIVLAASKREFSASQQQEVKESLGKVFEEQVLTKICRDKAVDSNSELDQVLKLEGLSVEQLRSAFFRVQMVSAFLASKTNSLSDIEEAKIASYYQDNLDQYTTQERMHCQEIEINLTGPTTAASARDRLNRVIDQCKAGADFGELAVKHSDALRSKADGEMGWIARGDLVEEELEAVLWKTEAGQITDVIERDDRMSIYRVLDRQEQRVTPLAEVRSEIERIFKREQTKAARIALLNDLKSKAVVAKMDFGDEQIISKRNVSLPDSPLMDMPSDSVRIPIKLSSAGWTGQGKLFGVSVTSDAGVVGELDLRIPPRVYYKQSSRLPVVRKPAGQRLEPRVYNVADLVVPIGRTFAFSDSPKEPEQQKDIEKVAQHDEAVHGEAAKLIELIRTTVSPDSWGPDGGGGTMAFNLNTLSIVIRATRPIHEQTVGLLHSIRKQQDFQVAVSIRMLATKKEQSSDWNSTLKVTQVQPGFSWAMATPKQMEAIEKRLKADEKTLKSGLSNPLTNAGNHDFSTGAVTITTFDAQRVTKTVNNSSRPVAHLTYSARIQSRKDLLQFDVQLAPIASTDLDTDARSLSTLLSTGTTLILKYQPSVTVGVPVLDKIPEVSQLFRNKSRAADGEDLYLFLTPEVVNVTEAEFELSP